MPVPWLRILDAVLGVTDLVVLRKATKRAEPPGESVSLRDDPGSRAIGHLETRLASVVVAALKEAFERDNRRLDLERERAEAERLQAERALKLELRRQAVDREVARLRLIGGLAVTLWIGSLFLWSRIIAGAGGATRIVLGVGWAFLLASLAVALGQSGVASRVSFQDLDRESPSPSTAGTLASWLLVAGLAFVGIAALLP